MNWNMIAIIFLVLFSMTAPALSQNTGAPLTPDISAFINAGCVKKTIINWIVQESPWRKGFPAKVLSLRLIIRAV